ncbi:MAG TPA: aldolase/citrate lyase family protein [Limnochordales bacterium]
MTNPLKERLRSGRPAFGTWLTFASPAVAEALALLQPDWLLVDTEHAAVDDRTLEEMLRAVSAAGTGVTPLVRVAANDVALVKKALDRGALGVLVPLVNSPEEARMAVAACRYPPAGVRGVAGARASRYGLSLPDYFAGWNDAVLVGVQIETRPALEAAEAIARVDGVDLLFVGPNDLSASLGLFRRFDHPDYRAAVRRVLEAARRAGKAAGYMARDAEEAAAMAEQGFQFVSVATDARMLMGAASQAFQRLRGA